jgi:PAS domain S-box-containing protein
MCFVSGDGIIMAVRKLLKWIKAIAHHSRNEQILQHLAMATKQTNEGIVVCELHGPIRFVNTACARMHGYETSAELLGKSIAGFYAAEQLKSTVAPIIEETKSRGFAFCKAEHIRKDNTTFPSHMKITLVTNEDGKKLGFIVLITDITERNQLEEALRQTTNQAKELEKQIEHFQNQNQQRDQDQQSPKQQAEEVADANRQLQQRIKKLEQAQEALSESQDHPIEEEVEPLNPKQLEKLSEMAKKLT